jgi:arylamine N-acetyltransferase
MTDLLAGIGFDARRVASSMLPVPDVPNRPNHGTTIVRFDDDEWLVDTSMLTEHPVRLIPGEETTGGEGILSVRAEPMDSLWRIWWKPWRTGPDPMPCELDDDSATRELYLARYQASTEFSPFNAFVYVRKGHAGGVRTLMGNTLVEVDRGGNFRQTDISDRRREVLTDLFGYSPEVVAATPPDEPRPEPPPATGAHRA